MRSFGLSNLFLSLHLCKLEPVASLIGLACRDNFVKLGEQVLRIGQLGFFLVVFIPFGQTKVSVVHGDELGGSFFVEDRIGEEDLATRDQLLLCVLFGFRHKFLDQYMKRHVISALEILFFRDLLSFIFGLVYDLSLASDAAQSIPVIIFIISFVILCSGPAALARCETFISIVHLLLVGGIVVVSSVGAVCLIHHLVVGRGLMFIQFTYLFILVPSTVATFEETFPFNVSLHFWFVRTSITVISFFWHFLHC